MTDKKKRVRGRPGADAAVAHRLQLPQRIDNLEHRVDLLQDVVGNNTEVFAAGFDMADRRIYTLMRVMNDSVALNRAPYKREEDGEVTIDWVRYYAELDAIQAFIVLAKVHGPAVQVEPDEEDYEESAIIFGGPP